MRLNPDVPDYGGQDAVRRLRIFGFALIFALLLHGLMVEFVSSTSRAPPQDEPLSRPIRFKLRMNRFSEAAPSIHEAAHSPPSSTGVDEKNAVRTPEKGGGQLPGKMKSLESSPQEIHGPEHPKVEQSPVVLSPDFLAQQISAVSQEIVNARHDEVQKRRIVHFQDVKEAKPQVSAYETAWQEKVERIGNLNFPEEARRDQLSGSLKMAVGIKSDGTVYSVQIVKSSGQPVLDAAAKRIIQLAAPFAPLPVEVRGALDVLVITRTWRFDGDYRFGAASR